MQPQGWKNFLFAVLLVPNGANLFCIKVNGEWAANLQASHIQNNSDVTIKDLAKTEVRHQPYHPSQPQISAIGTGCELENCFNRFPSLNYQSDSSFSPLTLVAAKVDIEGEHDLCKHVSDLHSLYLDNLPNCEPHKSLLTAQNGIKIPLISENTNKNQPDNSSPPLETVPNNFPIPSQTQIDKLLPSPEPNYAQRLERLRRRLQEAKQPLPESNTSLELGLRVREKPLSQKPLEQQPPPIKKSVPEFKTLGELQAHVGYFDTSNIFSSKIDPKVGGVIFSGLTIASAYFPLGAKTFLNGSIDGSVIHYTNQSQYDYNQIRFNLGLHRQLSSRMYGEIGWSNQQLFYTKNGDSPNVFKAGDRFLNETSLRLSLGRRDTLSSKLTLDSFYEFSLNIADPDSRNRIVNSLWVSLNYYLQKPLQIGFNYQFNLSNFTDVEEQSRRDEFHRLFGNLTYRISDSSNMNIQAGVTFGGSTDPNINFDGWFFSVNYNFDLGRF